MKFLAKFLFAAFLLLAGVADVFAQSAVLLPNGKQQFLDSNGAPLAGGTVNFYVAPNTTTPKSTWKDSSRSVLNTNPVVLDSSGEAVIYGVGAYRQLVKDVFGNTIWDAQTSGLGGDTYGGVSTGSANVQVLAATDFAARDGQQVSFVAGFTNTGSTTVNAGFGAVTVYKQLPTGPAVLSGGEIVAGNNVTLAYDSVNVRFYLLNLPSNFTAKSGAMYNGSIAVSVSGNALTVALKTAAGTDPSAADPVYIPLRNSTITNGTESIQAVTAALSATISSGSTLGTNSGQTTQIFVAYSLRGTSGGSALLIGLPTSPFSEGLVRCATDDGAGGSDSSDTFYASNANSNCGVGPTFVAATVIGTFFISEAAAGTWTTAPTAVATGTPAALSVMVPATWVRNSSNGCNSASPSCGAPTAVSPLSAAISNTNPRMMDLILSGISTNGTTGFVVQACTGASSGYLGAGASLPNGAAIVATTHTDGLFIPSVAAAAVVNGVVHEVFTGPPLNQVAMTFVGSRSDTGAAIVASTALTCTGTANSFALQTGNGTDLFDGGTLSLVYQY